MNRIAKTLLAGLVLAVLAAPAVSAAHSVSITSGKAKEGTYTMTVEVANFNLVPFADKTGDAAHKKGEGHIHYLVNGDPAEGDYATTSKSFTFRGLKEGDKVGAELVLSDHTPSGTNTAGTLDGSHVLTEQKVPSEGMGLPGVPAVVLLAALVALAAIVRRQ